MTILKIRALQSAYLRLCGSSACPAWFWNILTQIMRSSLNRTSKNVQNVGWVNETFAQKPLCRTSVLLFVRGRSSVVRSNMFHNAVGNKKGRRGGTLTETTTNVSILKIVVRFISIFIRLISRKNTKLIKGINHIMWGQEG